ncbi:MAG: PaaI family thioesterase [Lachnospiraceae bacterium]|nr:PaaI family thioesterase [Lachnospiraceae bacterium]
MSMNYEELTFKRNHQGGHMQDMGMEIIEIKKGYSKGHMHIEERMRNPYGAIHGGVMFSFADTVGGSAALSSGFAHVTSTGTINYLRPTTRSTEIYAIATEIKMGKTLSTFNVDIKDEHDRLVAQAVMTYYNMGQAVDYL